MRKRLGGFLFPALAMLLLIAASAVGSDRRPSGPDNAATRGKEFLLPRKNETGLSREAKRGRILYEYYCAVCHGKQGNSDGFNAYNLKTPPTRHTDPILMGTMSDTQIRRMIKEGGKAMGRSPQMPPWGLVLNDREITEVAAYIRTLAVPARR